jgi:uncharacterized protein
MIGVTYLNPTAWGDFSGLNRMIWTLSHIFADQKFMTIFSLLFGAGIALMTGRIEGRGLPSAGVHYRRTLWLLVIGLAHAHLLWYGDILVCYATCALWVYFFRKMKPRTLLIIGLLLFAIGSIIYILFGWSYQFWPVEAREEMYGYWLPGAEAINAELAAYRGGWLEQMPLRMREAFFLETFVTAIIIAWRVTGLMLIGMALYKSGVITAIRTRRFYRSGLTAGFAIGFPLIIAGIVMNFRMDWDVGFSMFLGSQFNYWGSLFVSFGYICLVMLICLSGRFSRMTAPLAAVGRTALTNYLMQTVICTLIFYGHGLGLFGRVERLGQILIVLGIWSFQLTISPLWLKRFRYGPCEWAWRRLTYGKVQKIRK